MTKIQELQSRVLELEQENEQLKKQLAASTTTPKVRQSKALQEATRTMELLRKGPVSVAMLAEINPRYPSDCVYNARRLFNAVIKTEKTKGMPTTYSLVTEGTPKADLKGVDSEVAEEGANHDAPQS